MSAGASRSGFGTAVLLAATALALPSGEAHACSVPVFRYSLERWRSSPFPVHVFHRGKPTDAEQALIEKLEAAPANLEVITVDLDDAPTVEQTRLWKKHGGGAKLPHVIVQVPDIEGPPVTAGRLDEPFVSALLDSPARRKLVRHLAEGATAVWILLESGDKADDDKAARILETELTRLQSELKLPEQEESDLLISLPLKISFVLLRIARSDSREAQFVAMLLGSDDELEGVEGPIAFPIFGRGRVLVGLHGERLIPALVERWASFLCGPCSCQVKELNPGVDLLLSADWTELLGLGDVPAVAPKPVLTTPAIPPGKTEARSATPDPSGGGEWVWITLGGGAVLVLVTVGLLLRDRPAPLA